jgi:hypothetical protein
MRLPQVILYTPHHKQLNLSAKLLLTELEFVS